MTTPSPPEALVNAIDDRDGTTEAICVLEAYIVEIYKTSEDAPKGLLRVLDKLKDKKKLAEGHLEYMSKVLKAFDDKSSSSETVSEPADTRLHGETAEDFKY